MENRITTSMGNGRDSEGHIKVVHPIDGGTIDLVGVNHVLPASHVCGVAMVPVILCCPHLCIPPLMVSRVELSKLL